MDDQPIKHVCGVCNDEWLTEAEYNTHTCPKTNATPEQPEHLINSTTPDFAAISEAAVARGAEESAEPAANEVPAEVATEQPALTQPTISLN